MVRRKTPKEFEEEVYQLVKDEYTILSDYEKSSKHVNIKHNICGNEYRVIPNNFFRGRRCPFCNGNNAKQKNTEQFKKEVYDLVGNEYEVIGDYVNRSTNIKMKHNKCGRVYYVQPGNFLYKSRCIECYYDSLRAKEEDIRLKVKNCLGNSYKILEYKGLSKEKSVLKHLKCNKTFKVRLNDVLYKKSGCPYCVQSRGEDYIESYLLEHNIEYEQQKRFEDLKSIRQLSYDFYIPKYNLLIEYQGEQHFKPKNFGGISLEEAKRRLEKQKIHDTLKRNYAKEHKYILIDISYKLNTLEKVKDFLDTKFTLLK